MNVLTEADEKRLEEASKSKLLRIAWGLEILARVSRAHDVAANHDVLYGGRMGCRERMDEREKALLDRLGWDHDSEYDNYSTSV